MLDVKVASFNAGSDVLSGPRIQDAPRNKTRQVHVGDVALGGGAPVVVQSMCNTQTEDTQGTLEQIHKLADLGCELVRVAVPRAGAVESFAQICAKSPLPVIADIHFDYRLALDAVKNGASAIRINPGNIGSMDRVDEVIKACKAAQIPIRIGVNAGSLDKNIDAREDYTIEDKLVASAQSFVEYFRDKDFNDIVLSAKVHSPYETIAVNKRLSQTLPEVPLHIGVTEAGTYLQGTVKSAFALGTLLSEGIGDTIRVSLTDEPTQEIKVCWEILQTVGIRRRRPELVSCPTCGRCQVNLIEIAKQVDERLDSISKPISVACMGCVVNGPGEAKGADIGIACGKGQGILFAQGQTIRTIEEKDIVDELFKEINERF